MFKKLLLLTTLAATIGVSAAPRMPKTVAPVAPANSPLVKSSIVAPRNIAAYAASRAETMQFSFCGNQAYGMYLNNLTDGMVLSQLTAISADLTSIYADAQITAINIANPSNKNFQNTMTDSVKVVIYTSLTDQPVYTQMAKLGAAGFEYTHVELKEPYTISGKTPVYFGFEFTYKTAYSTLSYIIVDDGSSPNYANYIGFGQPGAVQYYNNSQFGMTNNLCITADALITHEVNNCANGLSLGVDPAAEINQDFELEVEIKNFGTTPINSVGIIYSVNGVENTATCTLSQAIGGLTTGYASVFAKSDTTGFMIPITAKVTEVNGQPNTFANSEELEAYIDVLEQGMSAKRNLVIEEATGTWCGWCPIGYTLLESIREAYDDIVVIAVHSGDIMETSSYEGFIQQFITGYPQFMISRYFEGVLASDPTANEYYFDIYHQYMSAWPAIATLDFTPEIDSENYTIKLNTSTTFGISGQGTYRLAVVVKEDGVGPYRQTNNLYGTEGWGEFTTSVRPSLIYNDVARQIKTWNGILNSIPTEIEAGKTYNYSTDISFSAVSGDECDVVLMLINGSNGTIEQAVSKHLTVRDSAIEAVSANNSDAKEYFDLNGRKLNGPQSGVNIIRTTDGSTSKIIVR